MNEFKNILQECSKVFLDKLQLYGVSYESLSQDSLIDIIQSKINRIKHLQKMPASVKDESIIDTYKSIINYSIIYLIKNNPNPYVGYMEEINYLINIFEKKNKDYAGSWETMRVDTLIDILSCKLKRIQSIKRWEINPSNIDILVKNELQDIINYSVFNILKNRI